MVNKVRSARGVEVDFDVIKLKAQLVGATAPVSVTSRQSFINALDGVKPRPSNSAAKAHHEKMKAQLGVTDITATDTDTTEEIDVGVIEDPVQATQPSPNVTVTKTKSRAE